MKTEQKHIHNDLNINEIDKLHRQLQALSPQERLHLLQELPPVKIFLSSSPLLHDYYQKASPEGKHAIASVLAMDLGPNVFHGMELVDDHKELLKAFVGALMEIERFYDPIGGVIGYHLHALQLIEAIDTPSSEVKSPYRYRQPEGLDLKENTEEVRRMVRMGIEYIGLFAELYPVGGAGDRLHLQDETTGEYLPVAHLHFHGRSLLEGLIRDLQGREFLHYKFFARQCHTPVVLMTSHEKNNNERIMTLCQDRKWFGRDPLNFMVITQLHVPMVAVDGTWAMLGPLQPMMKPGGHGVLWKEALDQGVFDWLRLKRRRKALVRQINNPIGGIDNGVLALMGLGCQPGKTFGFASCYRYIGAPEGMVVLREKDVDGGVECSVTNVEYTDFKKCGINDIPAAEGSPYSRFPSNTNILVTDIAAVEKACGKNPIPGMLINVKHVVACSTSSGIVEKQAGRVESIMQNIADDLVDVVEHPGLKKGEANKLQTFLTYNDRSKTISVTKQAFHPEKGMMGTPEGAFYDLMECYRDLLENHCKMTLPPDHDELEYLKKGPPFVVDFHPAMGILYQILALKVRGGRLGYHAEWIMDVGEAYVENLDLEGSLIIEADAPMGPTDSFGIIRYDTARCGKCTLVNVTVRNAGADLGDPTQCYRRSYDRAESARIVIRGNGEFYAENVTFVGDVYFEVPENHRLVVYELHGEIAWHHDTISKPTWQWNYGFDEQENIALYREEL